MSKYDYDIDNLRIIDEETIRVVVNPCEGPTENIKTFKNSELKSKLLYFEIGIVFF